MALVLVMGVVGGVAMALEAGARRTDSAFDRFQIAHAAADAYIPNFPVPGSKHAPAELVAALPEVEAVARVKAMYLPVGTSEVDPSAGEVLIGFVPADASYGSLIDRPDVLRGRLADPARVDEVTLGFAAAERLAIDVGASIPLIDFGGRVRGVPETDLRVVGIVALPGEFPPQVPQGALGIHLTSAFYRERAAALNINRAIDPDGLLVRLREGATADELSRSLDAAIGAPVRIEDRATQADDVKRSIHMQAVGLRILGLFVGVAVLLVVGHTFARESLGDGEDQRTLRALGMARSTATQAEVIQALVRSGAGLTLATLTAVMLSRLFPRGIARVAETSPGAHFDVGQLLSIVPALVVVTAIAAGAPTWRRYERRAGEQPTHRSLVRDALLRLVNRPTMSLGLRAAFDGGSGPNAIPMRSSLAIASLGIAAIAGAAIFAASASRLTRDPSLYGVAWDAILAKDGSPSLGDPDGVRFLRRSPLIASASLVEEDVPIRVNGLDQLAMAFEPVKSPGVKPVVARGRAPATSEEILLGLRTMRELGVDVGDIVQVRFPDGTDRPMTVVGSAITPASRGPGNSARQSEGAAIRWSAYAAVGDDAEPSAYVRLAPGATSDDAVRSMTAALGGGYEGLTPAPVEITDFGNVEELPMIIAGVLAGLVAATSGHIVATATRRRRRDLALLQAIGFRRRDIWTTIIFQSEAFLLAAILFGIPLGIAIGRVIWTTVAHETGVLASPSIPAGPVAALGAGASLIGVLACLVPAMSAVKAAPAAGLRVE